jgi:5-formyltetrahydrofolate cyclo-ligase
VTSKAALRALVRERRARRDPAQLEAAGAALAAHVDDLVRPVVAAFIAMRGEPPTLPLLRALHARGARLLVPILLEDRDLDWAFYAEGEPLAGEGRDAIATAEIVLAPALAVDRAGHRLGQGGGSYDRALGRTSAPVLAVVFDDDLLDDVPTEPHDRPVHGVLTPVAGMQWFDRTLKAPLP